MAALVLACGARPAAEEPAPAADSAAPVITSPAPRPVIASPAPRPVAVADLEGDADRAFKQRLLRDMRGRVQARPILELETAIRTAHLDDPIASMGHGHAQARALLADTGAIAIVWGRLGQDAPALYVTTADAGACADADADQAARDTPCRPVDSVDSGATWALCASDWAWLWPACDAP